MYFKQFYVGCLAHASYLIGDKGEAVVVDPSRDVEMYLKEAEAHGFKITWILETHLHADFVSGHRELAAKTGATIGISAKAGARYDHKPLHEGDEIWVGDARMRAVETPGHTPESMSFLVFEHAGDEQPASVLTGDTLFVGDVGRVDILSSRMSVQDLAGLMFDSVQRLMQLPDHVRVYPAHGAGSLCGRSIRKETWSTIGQERTMNPALQIKDRDAFVKDITRDVPETPVYFLHSRDLNQAGPRVRAETDMPPMLSPLEFQEAAKNKSAVTLDTRSSAVYAACHLKGALNVGLDGQYASWVGTLVRPDQPILLLCEPGREEEAVMRLARVGYESVVGILDGGCEAWKGAGLPTTSLAAEAATKAVQPGRRVLDVRRASEWHAFHLKDAVHAPLAKLEADLAKLDREADWVVVCAGGYRSGMAASLMERAGFKRLTIALGGMDAYKKAGLPVEVG